jgi:hypothetical protein
MNCNLLVSWCVANLCIARIARMKQWISPWFCTQPFNPSTTHLQWPTLLLVQYGHYLDIIAHAWSKICRDLDSSSSATHRDSSTYEEGVLRKKLVVSEIEFDIKIVAWTTTSHNQDQYHKALFQTSNSINYLSIPVRHCLLLAGPH